jgi:hypothetical protein
LKIVLEGKNTLKYASKWIGVFSSMRNGIKKDLSLNAPKGLFIEIEVGHPPKALNHALVKRIISLGHSI